MEQLEFQCGRHLHLRWDRRVRLQRSGHHTVHCLHPLRMSRTQTMNVYHFAICHYRAPPTKIGVASADVQCTHAVTEMRLRWRPTVPRDDHMDVKQVLDHKSQCGRHSRDVSRGCIHDQLWIQTKQLLCWCKHYTHFARLHTRIFLVRVAQGLTRLKSLGCSISVRVIFKRIFTQLACHVRCRTNL